MRRRVKKVEPCRFGSPSGAVSDRRRGTLTGERGSVVGGWMDGWMCLLACMRVCECAWSYCKWVMDVCGVLPKRGLTVVCRILFDFLGGMFHWCFCIDLFLAVTFGSCERGRGRCDIVETGKA